MSEGAYKIATPCQERTWDAVGLSRASHIPPLDFSCHVKRAMEATRCMYEPDNIWQQMGTTAQHVPTVRCALSKIGSSITSLGPWGLEPAVEVSSTCAFII